MPLLRSVVAWVALLAIGLGMFGWTWLAWPDVLIDFGRELYVPWRIAGGSDLYVDVAYFNGPLSPHWNALWFRVFGPGIATLVAVNAILLVLLTGLLHHLLRAVGSALAADVACAVFLILFAFAQLVGIGNYNYLSPYSHELTHGLVLCLGALACLGAVEALPSGPRRTRWVLAAGGLLGGAALTKPEILLAGGAAFAAGLASVLWREGAAGRESLRTASGLLAAALAPPLLAWAWLGAAIPLETAARGIVGPWSALFTADIASIDFYRHSLGTDDISGNAVALLAWAGAAIAVLAPGVALAFALRTPGRARPWIAAGLFALTAGVLLALRPEIRWAQAARPLPLFMAALALFCAGPALRRGPAPVEGRPALRLALVVFAAVLLAKMILHARIQQYGFALAMPATLVLVVAWVDWIPRWLSERGAYGAAFRASALAVLVALLSANLDLMARQLSRKDFLVGEAPDRIRSDRIRGPAVQSALVELSERLGPDGTLVVMPEGVTLNYLLRRPNPTPFINWMPPEYAIFGESAMIDSLAAHPPDMIALVHKDTEEYGFRFFGRDYANATFDWVQRNYRPVLRIGEPPFVEKRQFGILLLERLERKP
ncbi:MAG: hypothetical protein O7G30_06210 [Proteobacteria bacterium]|nr:hypothetical protein [Pseudomonadota bacterium]